jgi:NAD-dependent DNA ligase
MSSELPDISYLANCEDKEFYSVVKKISKESRKELSNRLKENYFNSPNPIPFGDDRFDYINNYDNEEDELVGIPVPKEVEFKLPTHMGSLDKVKTEKELRKFIVEDAKSYIVSAKLDGVSCLYYKNELFTRGDSNYGTKLTGLLKYLLDQDILPRIPEDSEYETMVRGELVISKENFKNFRDDFSCPRNFVSGIVNSKEIPERTNQIEFIAHELITQHPMSIYVQFMTLEKMGFTVVMHNIIDPKYLNINDLERILNEMKSVSKFEIDGIVVQESDGEYKRPKTGNPKYVFAFKKNIFVTTTVKEVLWKPSKRGQIKPTIRVEPTNLSGALVEYCTGKNAKFIMDNNIGHGAIVSITRSGDVIPFIDCVVKGTIAQMPDPDILPYTWNETETDILVNDLEGDEVKEALIENFFKEFNIKYLGEKTIKKLYERGYHSAIDIVHATELDLASVIGEKIAKKIKEQLDKEFNGEVDQVALMSASGCFGLGLGRKKIKLIMDAVPDLLGREDFSDIEVKGIAEKTMNKIIDGIPKFKKFMENLNDESHPCILLKNNNSSRPLLGKTFILTGFRDIKGIIQGLGGNVTDKVTKFTTAVICKDKNANTNKLKDAEKYGVKIITKEEFMEEYGL